MGNLPDERVGYLVAQHPRQLWRHRLDAGNRDPNFAVIQGRGPGWSLGYVKKSLVGIERYKDVFGRSSQIVLQVFVFIFQGIQYLRAQGVRDMGAFIAQSKVTAVLLPEIRFGLGLALHAFQQLPHSLVRMKLKRFLERGNGFAVAVILVIGVAQDTKCLGELWAGAGGLLSVRQGFGRPA